jgi:hypothetical protein|tara:strand:+ start:522 stop:1748 length:1227 start_codon:yes stop_codon:yes gene_type:complete
MQKQLLFLFLTILCINCYSQVSFEKGYYIDNNNQKIKCLIKNLDWKNNPSEFKYKLLENDKPKNITIKSIKEFGIDNVSKYIRSTVNIDRSSESIQKLSNEKKPLFKKENLFLKILIGGKSNLYEYVDGNLNRYFYSKDGTNIKQLIFKMYKTNDGNNIAKNHRFRQQLWANLECTTFKMSKIKNINYKKNDLIRFFTEYNKCGNVNLLNFGVKEKRDLFNLTIRPRLNSSSLEIQNTVSNSINIDSGNEIGFGFGLEAEFILPFNKNKWAIVVEPTYKSFKSKKTGKNNNVSGGQLITEINYNSIEIPISLRHYLFLNKSSKLFINASYIFDFSSKSSIEFKRADNSSYKSLDIISRPNLGLGIGYKQNDKYSLEIRYQTDREVLSEYITWNSEYKSLSVIFGYSLF